MNNKHYILKDIKPIEVDLFTWGKWVEESKERIIKQETLENGKRISTVFLGLDHSFNSDKILLFETMVFPDEKTFSELDMNRYSTYEEAIKGHQEMVDKWK